MAEPIPYAVGGIDVAPGPRRQIKLPGLVFRGRLTGLLFETNKTFLLRGSLKGIRGLRNFYDQHPGMQVLVVGHTDTVGPPQANLTLSIERAKSIAAYLTDDADFWMEFYPGRAGSSVWGVREDQHMLSELADGTKPFYTGPIDGQAGSGTKEAVEHFQQFSNEKRGTKLAVDGRLGQKTRREIVLAYMQLPGTTLPAKTILKTHGCGKFNLAKKTPDETPEPENRRVEVFFFEGMIDPPPRDRCPAPGCPEEPIWVKKAMHTFDLSHDPGALLVRVQDQKGGPVGTAQVHLAGPTLGDDKSDGNGVVIFRDLIPGHYTILARKEGLQNGTAESDVASLEPGAKDPGPGSGTSVTLKAGTGGLGVSVSDDAGQPVGKATVRVLDGVGKEVAKEETSDQGGVKFDGLPAGSYTLEISATGFNFKTVPATVTADKDTPQSVQLDPTTGSLEVTVKDEGGALLDGVEVTVAPAKGAAPKPDQTVKGVVTFSKVRTGVCTISAVLNNFTPGKGSATIKDGAKATAAITLKAATTSLGVRVVSTGPGKRGLVAKVTISGPAGTTEPTDSQGNVTFKDLPLGTYQVSAELEDFEAPPAETVTVATGKSNFVNIKLKPKTGKLLVTVLDDGKPLDGAEVRVRPPAPSVEQGPRTTKDKKPVEFDKVPIGDCDVLVKMAGFKDAKGTATVVGDSSVSIKIPMVASQMPFTVTVKSSAGGVLEGAGVSIDGGPLGGTSGMTDQDGFFKVKSIAVGDYQVSASLDNHSAPAPVKVTVAPATENAITIELQPDAITAEIAPAALRVVVKKNVCKPARKKVTLQTKGPAFKGKGKLSISKPTVKLFDKGGKEITSADELDGAALTAGLDLFAEGVSASGSVDDTELTLELFVGKNKFGIKGAAKATAVELTLDLFNIEAAAGAAPAVQDEKARTTVGRFVHLQDAGLRHSRALAVVREAKPDFGGTLELHVVKAGGGDVKLFDAAAPGGAERGATVTPAELKKAKTIGAAVGVPVFVEGGTVSTAVGDLFLQLGILGDEPDGDRALLTVFKLAKIDMTLQASPCKRTGVRAAMPTKTSLKDERTFAAADPTVVHGCGDVDFLAAVSPPKVPLSWLAVQASDDTGEEGTPTVTKDPADSAKMKLTADAAGSFHVMAFVDQKANEKKRAPAESGLTFNLNMVKAEVMTGAGDNKFVTNNNFEDESTATVLGVQAHTVGSGVPPSGAPAPAYGDAALANVAAGAHVAVKLVGGGADQLRGVSQVGLGFVQDMVNDNFQGTYADGKTSKESFPQDPATAKDPKTGSITTGTPAMVGFPMLDRNPAWSAGYGAMISRSSDREIVSPLPDGEGEKRTVRFVDPPAVGLRKRHSVSKAALASISGSNDFHDYLVAFSKDFDQNFTVLGEGAWSVTFGSYTAAGGWSAAGGAVTGPSSLTVHTPPKPAEKTDIEFCPPKVTDILTMDDR